MALEVNQFFVQGLIGTLYQNSKLAYVVSNNKRYYNGGNTWYEPDSDIEDSDDKNIYHCIGEYSNDKCECKFDDEPDNIEEYKITLNDIEDYDFNYLEECEEEDKDNNEILKLAIKKIVPNPNHKLFNISVNTKIYLKNDSGINDDHRGADHTKIRLDFNPLYQLKSNTLNAFLEGLYRIKSHKFDYNYEMFCIITNIQRTMLQKKY